MFERAFKFTGKDLTKLSIMMIVATLLFGLPGLIIMLLFHWITHQTYALESSDKHGISQVSASRLGGAAVFCFSLVLYVLGAYAGFSGSRNMPGIPWVAFLTVLACMCIGLVDDIRSNSLSPRHRLWSTFILFSVCLWFWQSLIPTHFGIPLLDSLLSNSFLAWVLSAVFCVGFVNAVNMADGANGLMPSILTVAFIVFYLETGFLIYAVLIASCGLFALFNVISGRLFLGDAGAYGLGSVLVLSGLYLFSEKTLSAPYLAVLFSYPCIDILVTVIRRKIRRRSILLPDNDHLHNRVHFHFQKWFRSKTLANSVTGLLIVSCSSGIALIGLTQPWWDLNANDWLWIFAAQFTLYIITFISTGLNRPLSQYVAS